MSGLILDCFTYYNETDVLRMRLEELGDTVDYFVIVEASQTFTGKEKPLYFDTLPSWVHKWQDKIVRYIVDFPSADMSPWERETYQRNEIYKAVPDGSARDWIFISDADEIPNIKKALKCFTNARMQLDVRQYFWKLNWQVPQHCNQGARPVMVRRDYLESPQVLRAAQLERIPDCGWHFSFLTDEVKTVEKIEAFAHTEVDKEEFKVKDSITRRINEGVDPFDRFPLKLVPIDSSYPKWIQNNEAELAHLIMKMDKLND